MDNWEWVTRYSWPSGFPYRVLEDPSDDMLPVPAHFLDCVIYVYPTKAAADKNEELGGSGFLVSYPFAVNSARLQLYAVTNLHVIKNHPNPAIRINTVDGGREVLETNKNRWVSHPDGDDLAVLPIDVDEDNFKLTCIPIDKLINRKSLPSLHVMPGDEVFMLGRFVSLDGTTSNTPTVRFGNVARIEGEPIENKYGHPQESFLIDCRSIPGYSGSPVFITLWPPKPRPPMWLVPANDQFFPPRHGPFLLGIDWLHINNYEPVERYDKGTKKWVKVQPKRRVKANTGIAGVIPAWRISDLLERPELKNKRDRADEQLTADKRDYVSLDSAVESEPQPTQKTAQGARIPVPTKEQFFDTLRKASRKKDSPTE